MVVEPDEQELLNLVLEMSGDSESSDSIGANDPCKPAGIQKKRKSRSKYGAPKVWKDDIRWTYSKILANAMNSMDPYLTWSFFKTFARPDFVYRVDHINQNNEVSVCYSSESIALYVIRWYVRCLVAPDSVVKFEAPLVRNLPNGTSIIVAGLCAEKTIVFQHPSLPEHIDFGCNSVSTPKHMVPSMVDIRKRNTFNPRIHLLSLDGVRVNKGYCCEKRIRVDRCATRVAAWYAEEEECNFLDELESLVASEPLSEPQVQKVCGTLVLRLDENKKISSLEYLLKN